MFIWLFSIFLLQRFRSSALICYRSVTGRVVYIAQDPKNFFSLSTFP